MTDQQTETAPPPVVFVDTETTGLGPDRVPWEIAVIRRDPDTGSETAYRWFLPLTDVSAVDGFALRVGRFWDRHPYGRHLSGKAGKGGAWHLEVSDPELVAGQLMQLTHGATWVGANPAFDAQLVELLLRKHGMQPTWDYHLIDTTVLALGFLHSQAGFGVVERPGVPYRSQQLTELLGVEPTSEDERHTALGDARWCQRLYDRITGAAA